MNVLLSLAGTSGNPKPGMSPRGVVVKGRQRVPPIDPLLEPVQGGQGHGRVELGHPGVQPHEPAVVVDGVAVVPAHPAPLRQHVVVGGDDPPFSRHQDLGGRKAEHLRVAERADGCASMPGPEGIGGVEEQPMPQCRAIVASSSTAQGVPKVWVAKMAEVRTPTARATAWGDSVRVAGSISAKTGRKPFQATACAVAANVNEGTTSPDTPRPGGPA